MTITKIKVNLIGFHLFLSTVIKLILSAVKYLNCTEIFNLQLYFIGSIVCFK